MSPTRLSYKKFSKLLIRNGYIISLIYYIENDTREAIFFEIKLPKSQKNIIIYVPPNKYTMILPKELNYKIIELISVEDDRVKSAAFILTERSLHYLIGMRGPLIESDMAVVSSNGICYTKFNGENFCYFMANKVKKLEEKLEENLASNEESSAEDEIDLLEASVKKMAKKEGVSLKSELEDDKQIISNESHQNKSKHSKTRDDPPDQITSVENVQDENIIPERTQVEPVELEFVDDPSSDEVEDTEEEDYSLESSSSSSGDEVNNNVTNKESKNKSVGNLPINTSESLLKDSTIKLSHRTNYVIPEELDVYYGAVYVGSDISTLYKNVDNYEADALLTYEQIDDNEKDMRITRLNTTKKKIELASKHVDERVKSIELEEKGLKYQLLRLTGIMHNIDTLKKNKTTKGIENVVNPNMNELNRIYDKTRKTVHDINLQLLQKREEYEDILTDYEYNINELLEL